MRTVFSSESLDVLPGCEVTVRSKVVTVVGKHGTLVKDFNHVLVDMYLVEEEDKKTIKMEMWLAPRSRIACLRTVRSHIHNMMIGVTQKYRYKMRFASAHFPINCNIPEGNDRIELRNFLGEKRTRVVKMLGQVTIIKSPVSEAKDQIVLEGCSLENVSQSAALIHQSALVRNKDIRKFLDGIYITEKTFVDAVA
eukprot:Lankesteria_metandrocarpae@DN1223_c0_g1_i1.p1